MNLGRRSTLFLSYAYQFDAKTGDDLLEREADLERGAWKRQKIQGAALLPHLDDYVRKGELLRCYEVANDLRAAFGPRDRWTLTDGDKTVDVAITDPPRLYTFDTRYAFMVLGVTPLPPKETEPSAQEQLQHALTPTPPAPSSGEGTASSPPAPSGQKKKQRGKQAEPELTLKLLEDTAYYVVRAGVSKVKEPPIQMQRWLQSKEFGGDEHLTLRRWLARLVPGLPHTAPRGTPRTTAPGLFSVVLAPQSLDDDDLHRLRLVHRSDQQVEPGASVLDESHGVWRCSSQELCMFSSFGFSWVVEGFESSKFLSDTPHMIRDRYLYKWLIVEHQRLCLLALATECADMSKGLDGANFAEMRMQLLTFIAKYNFRHISNEERHDRFYRRAQESLAIDDLLEEVREEVVEIDTQLSARRAETLNHVLAFLTLVLTPVGIFVGVFQSDTIPGKFQFDQLITPSSWLKLITHPPFIAVLTAALLGATVYVRLFGATVVIGLLKTLVAKRKKYDESNPEAEPAAPAKALKEGKEGKEPAPPKDAPDAKAPKDVKDSKAPPKDSKAPPKDSKAPPKDSKAPPKDSKSPNDAPSAPAKEEPTEASKAS